ncbi:MAG: alginate lyase family protein [Gammaproteobacteria bacterium]|nr:alginate lyase family protein [Gammaproteobacteria bacterium]
MPRLWRYNLHYFDYLQEAGHRKAELPQLINHWIEHNPLGTENAWEPYTASLRIVNWIKYFLATWTKTPVPHAWLVSLYTQCLWLEKHLEYHILANHYLKNAVALFFAGMYFEGMDAARWLKTGSRILTEEVQEQFLGDGGHIERSPMYHCIAVTDYLDILNLVQNSISVLDTPTVQLFRDKTVAALDFLDRIILPDGQIPLFNDAALGIAPTPERLFTYAAKIIKYQSPGKTNTTNSCAFTESGYYVIRYADDMMVIDCGPVGPDYQPGHAHCDTLSYELCICGQRLVVDTGVYSYENSADRYYARSTAAHNTVRIDAREQSEIWGVFRVARRARPTMAALINHPDGGVEFNGAHDGYLRLPGRVVHARSIRYHPSHGWYIRDTVTGRGRHRLESFIHFHPAVKVQQVVEGVRLMMPGGEQLLLLPEGQDEMSLIQTNWYPEFGRAQPNTTLRLACIQTLPWQFGYSIRYSY